MTRIILLSDSHGYLDQALIPFLNECDEIWHAGDFGRDVYDQLLQLNKPIRGVYGNIDGPDVRSTFPENLIWTVERTKIFMTHIGGYPGKYSSRVQKILMEETPQIYVCGHSHILKIIYDKKLNLLHLNPGACGKEGFHKVKTALKFMIDGDKVKEMGVIELGLPPAP